MQINNKMALPGSLEQCNSLTLLCVTIPHFLNLCDMHIRLKQLKERFELKLQTMNYLQ